MYGRSSCLLAISILILAPALLPGQSGREEPAPEFAIPLPPRVVRPPIGEPFRPFLPRLPVTPPFTIEPPDDRPRGRHYFFRYRHCNRSPSRDPRPRRSKRSPSPSTLRMRFAEPPRARI